MFLAISTYFRKSDLISLLLALSCSIYGLFLINSATASFDSRNYIIIQACSVVVGLVAYIIVSLFDIDRFYFMWKPIFVINCALQCLLFFYGVGGDTTGNNSWIRFGSIGVQPAEIGKVLFIITFSTHTALLRERMNHIKYLTPLLLHAGIMCGLILITSSDMGMAIVYGMVTITILYVAGLSMKWFYAAIIAILAVVPIVWNFVLGGYQKMRILVIFDPSLDPDTAYQGLQSQMAIGSGGISGTGYMQGTLTQFGWLPAKHTDFIFSSAAEELGFIGAVAIIVLLLLLIIRIFFVCLIAPTDIGSLICAGVGGMLLYQSIQNILMCLVLAPVIGLTLPFFSYGGTSTVTMYFALGLVSGIKRRESL
ncbi:MAG: FtsW/RodA/SpoVE family cell cycle protein [Clostridia bacterium]